MTIIISVLLWWWWWLLLAGATAAEQNPGILLQAVFKAFGENTYEVVKRGF